MNSAQLSGPRPVWTRDGSTMVSVSDPDVALMLAFAQGREEAFVELYTRHRDRIVRYARRMLGDQAKAEEAAQDVFLKLYRARGSYQAKSRFSTYLYRIATNHCINLHARVERRLVVNDSEAIDRALPAARNQHDALSNNELRASLEVALDKLPQHQRAALLLVHYEGLSYRDAAEAIEVSEGAIKSLIHRARSMLMVELAPLLDAALDTRPDTHNEVKHAL